MAAFSMNMTFSKDGLFFTNNEFKHSNYEQYKKLYKVYQKSISEYNSAKSKNFNKLGLLLDLFKSTLDEIDKEISIHESKVNELYALRQAILDDVHHIGRDNFEFLERQIMYSFIRKS